MGNGIYSVVSGAVANMRRMEAVSNNLSNVSTPGFKADKVPFSEVLSRMQASGTGESLQRFVKADAPVADFSPGRLSHTEDPLDLSLDGPGFLVLKRGEQTVFNRGGRLAADSEGMLVDAQGHRVLGDDDQPLKVGPDATGVKISEDGTVATKAGVVGHLKLVEFDDPRQLQRIGGPIFVAPAGVEPVAAEKTTTKQGYVESSNVNTMLAVSEMVMATRRYEALHRMIATFGEMDRRAATIAKDL